MATVETAPASIEAMRRVLAYLAEERHQLHARGADAAELEANAKAIASMRAQIVGILGRASSQDG
jgi:hypothetical protein